jgi:hypothetical protein
MKSLLAFSVFSACALICSTTTASARDLDVATGTASASAVDGGEPSQ